MATCSCSSVVPTEARAEFERAASLTPNQQEKTMLLVKAANAHPEGPT